MSLSPKQRDAMAREIGFDSYEAWKLWTMQQEKKTNPKTAAKPKVKNVLQGLEKPQPKTTRPGLPMNYVARRVLEATKK